MRVIVTPNPDPPFGLRRIFPNPDLYESMTEDAVLSYVVERNKAVGVIPCESEEERQQVFASYQARHLGHPGISGLVLPPVGLHFIVEEDDYSTLESLQAAQSKGFPDL